MKKLLNKLFPDYQKSKAMPVMFGILWLIVLGVMIGRNGTLGIILFVVWTIVGFIPALLLWNKSMAINWTGDFIEDPKERSADTWRQFKAQTIAFIAMVYALVTWAIFTLGPST